MFYYSLTDRLWLCRHRKHGEIITGLTVGMFDSSGRGWLCRGCGAAR